MKPDDNQVRQDALTGDEGKGPLGNARADLTDLTQVR
jgi:hypothetical protein